jgi:LemA protein
LSLTLVIEAITAIIVILVLSIVLIFNGLIAKRNRVQNAWAQIDVQLKRRYDLIPNLIETVKGYMTYEKGVLTDITKLRSAIVSGSVQERASANNMLSQTLKSLFAVVENYPDLKASESLKNLQQELEVTEDKISFVRTSYNDYVLSYNNAIQQFPGNVFAGVFGFKKSDFFEAPSEAKEPVKVDLNLQEGQKSQTPQPASQKNPKK